MNDYVLWIECRSSYAACKHVKTAKARLYMVQPTDNLKPTKAGVLNVIPYAI